ncbi:glycosyltransferase [Corallococcus sp. AS-1-6]|uniref:glycosyltransferase n=1 Tax=Corallococcus TaxID=83461 RepID=UPI001CBDC62F|nr:glycosyltransferase [Corallococcus sp. AS-1-6]MBZ4374123.1 glycosyltransferase [Corallococcus sp. AS-1-6]
MATIVLAPLPVPGHVNPSLRIARSLQGRGHRVHYLGILELEDEVRAEGFEFTPLFADVFPKGKLSELRATAARLKGPRLLWFLRTQAARFNQALQRMVDGEVDDTLRALRPDLLICDEKLRHLSVIGHGLGIPVLQMNVTIPPELIPREAGAERGPGRGGAMPGERLLTALGFFPRLRPSLLALARKHRYPLKEARGMPALDRALSPELLLCPREFAEVRVPSAPGEYCYIEPCIDRDRREPDFPWERLSGDRPLVFFALGTLAATSAHNLRILREAFLAAGRRPDLQFVIAVGSSMEPSMFDVPPGVIAVKVAPQLGLLRKAAVMVNHAGTNSVKECIAFGVPMVSIPLQFDQPDIGRLVELHGVGRTIAPRDFTADRLLAALDGVLKDPACKQACEQLRTHFLQSEQTREAAGPIEAFIGRRAHGGPAAPAQPQATGS